MYKRQAADGPGIKTVLTIKVDSTYQLEQDLSLIHIYDEWMKFLVMYEQTDVKAKAVFAKARIFGEPFKVCLLYTSISISIHSNLCGNDFCFLNGLFRLHILILSCVFYKSQPSSKKDSPRTSD